METTVIDNTSVNQAVLPDGNGGGLQGIDSLLLSAKEAAKLIGVGRSHFYALHSSGRLGPMPISLGRRTLWKREELENWVRASCPTREQWQNRETKL